MKWMVRVNSVRFWCHVVSAFIFHSCEEKNYRIFISSSIVSQQMWRAPNNVKLFRWNLRLIVTATTSSNQTLPKCIQMKCFDNASTYENTFCEVSSSLHCLPLHAARFLFVIIMICITDNIGPLIIKHFVFTPLPHTTHSDDNWMNFDESLKLRVVDKRDAIYQFDDTASKIHTKYNMIF